MDYEKFSIDEIEKMSLMAKELFKRVDKLVNSNLFEYINTRGYTPSLLIESSGFVLKLDPISAFGGEPLYQNINAYELLTDFYEKYAREIERDEERKRITQKNRLAREEKERKVCEKLTERKEREEYDRLKRKFEGGNND